MHAKRKYEDLHTHKGMRKLLVEELRAKGITDEAVLTAMNNVPRHYFLDTAFEKIAYENRAFPIAADQTISHPYTVAYQTQLLQIQKTDRVLEIGTGSMYQTSILAEMGVQKIFTIERQKKLYDLHSVYVFKTKYLNIQFFYGDGFAGLPTYGPFTKILITCGAPHIPEKLIEQLAPGGIMVIPVDEGEAQRMLRIKKLPDGSLLEERFEEFSFVPMLAGKNH
ncbi:MAG: protein-L-isoaspartate(D-aspartate) O-methyltransferase [Chitinophagaceae bacterium]|nr:protein-L-isoaspartate(D-aspartate) O-methyltransferase [Chitinophagaceae bacterium]